MEVREIMTRDPESLRPESTVTDAARLMDRLDVGAMPVADGRKLAGLVTDRDIVVRSVAKGIDPTEATVDTVATREVATCFEDDDVRDLRQLMKEKQIRRVPVLSRDRDLVGIVALADLALETDEATSGDVLETVSRPS